MLDDARWILRWLRIVKQDALPTSFAVSDAINFSFWLFQFYKSVRVRKHYIDDLLCLRCPRSSTG